MNKIIEKCDVCINGSVVSKELLIKTFSSFVSSTIEDKQHNDSKPVRQYAIVQRNYCCR